MTSQPPAANSNGRNPKTMAVSQSLPTPLRSSTRRLVAGSLWEELQNRNTMLRDCKKDTSTSSVSRLSMRRENLNHWSLNIVLWLRILSMLLESLAVQISRTGMWIASY
uniref:Uncharacterized protein n=1 Tax=Cacopsylla melanoneura TaxID=428564 RepID=A0A8D8ULB7_9HEMI